MSLRTVIAALFSMLLALVLRVTYGTYHSGWLMALLAGFFALAVGLAGRRWREQPADGSPDLVVSTVLFAFALMLWLDPLVVLATGPTAMAGIQGANTVLAVAAGGLFALAWLRRSAGRPACEDEREGEATAPAEQRAATASPENSVRDRAFATLVACAWCGVIASRLLTLPAAPRPNIDVLATNTLACDYFLAGRNPYAAEYPDVYQGRYGYAPGFFYWPAYLYWAAPFRAVAGDVRFAGIAADILAAVLLAAIARKLGLPRTTAALAPLVWLAHPVGLFVTELAWIDPVLIAGMAAVTLALIYRRWLATGMLLGIVMSTKQYGLVAALCAGAYVAATERAALRRVALAAAATFALVVCPFVALDAAAFFERTVAVYLSAPLRADSLSLAAWAKNRLDWEVPVGFLGTAYAAILAGGLWRLARSHDATPADLTASLALVFGGIFLVGKQAFCNYYYLVAFFVLLCVVASLADDRRRFGEASSPARRWRIVRGETAPAAG